MNEKRLDRIVRLMTALSEIRNDYTNAMDQEILALSVGHFGMEVHMDSEALIQLAYDLKVKTEMAPHGGSGDFNDIWFIYKDVKVFCLVENKEIK